MKSGNLNFVEYSGPLQAYNGTALLFYSVGGYMPEHDATYLWLITCNTVLATLSLIVDVTTSKLKQIHFSLSPQSAAQCSHFRLRQYLRPVIREDIDLPSCGWSDSRLHNCEFAATSGQILLIGCVWKRSVQSSTGHGARATLTLNPLQPSGYYIYRQFHIPQFYSLPTQCIYVFCVDLSIKWLVFYNLDCVCLLGGTALVFKCI